MPEYGEVSKAWARKRLAWLDEELAGRPFVAGERYTIADIMESSEKLDKQLLDNALISAGLLEDTTAMVARLNKLLACIEDTHFAF